MPFAMTHLYIAYNILMKTTQIKKPSDFLLGAIAPDSVHYRVNYNSDMKKKSHLCVGDEKWGRVTNNIDWQNNVLDFLKRNKHRESKDYVYGYSSHILADIQNNILIWTPFRKENIESLEKGLGSIYHQESYDIDFELYLLSPHQKEIWKLLEEAIAYDISDIVVGDEVSKMRYDILNNQYKNRKTVDISTNKYVTLSVMEEYISKESRNIKQLLFGSD